MPEHSFFQYFGNRFFVRIPSRALGNRRFSVPFFIVKSGLCGLFGNKITGDVLCLLLVTFFGVFNHFEYTWMIMKEKVFNLVSFFKINCGKSIFYHYGLSAKKQRRKTMSRYMPLCFLPSFVIIWKAVRIYTICRQEFEWLFLPCLGCCKSENS